MNELTLQSYQDSFNPFPDLKNTGFFDNKCVNPLEATAQVHLPLSLLPTIEAVQHRYNFVPESLSWDNIFGWKPAITDILQQDIYPKLQEFAQLPDFQSQMRSIFGDNLDAGKLKELTSEWLVGNFQILPQIEVLEVNVFPTETLGAFAGETNKIYLSEKLLNIRNSELIKDTIIEEVGHFLDQQINFADTPGDEGQLFAAVVTGKQLNADQIAEIRTEDDTTIIFENGKYLTVEQATLSTVTIAASDATAGETLTGQTANPGRFTLQRTGDLTSTLAVNYTLGGTASNGTDYNQLSGIATFSAGLSTATIDLTVINDALLEAQETVIVTLASSANYTLGTTKTATVNLVDNDKPTITISATDASAGETLTGQIANPGRFTLTRTGDLSSSPTVNYTLGGTAINGTDYYVLGTNVNFAAGSATAIIDVNIKDDAVYEGNETVILNLASSANYTLGTTTTATVNLVDNDKPTITISATDASAGETLTGQTANPGKLTLTRTGITTSSLTVNYTVAGIATNGTDYQTLTKSVTFAAGSATAIINLTPIDDAVYEGNETAIVTLASNTNYVLGAAKTATVNLVDNDKPTITISATDASAGETLTGQTANPGKFTLTRTGNITASLTVNYTVTGIATNGTDYNTLTGIATFSAGSATAIIDVNVKDDAVYEGNETAIVTLVSSTNYVLGTAKTATVNLVDNDKPTITISATDASAGETLTGQTANPGKFTLTRTGSTTSSLTVNYTVAGIATNGTDYQTLTGIATFSAGSATAIINVNVKDDAVYEGNETAIVTLASGTNYILGTTKTATVNLVDNDKPTITISATDASAGETVTGQTANPGQFTISRSGITTSSLTVNYTLTGTATKGTDYNTLTGTVTFAAGASTAVINVTPVDDTISEPNETVILNLTTSNLYNLGTAKTATVNLADNDIPVINVSATDASAGETLIGQTANPGQFTLTRIGNLASALTVNYAVTGTATKGTDYNNLTGTASFAAGAATAVVKVTPIDDKILEGSETVIFTITSGTNYKLGTDIAATLTIDNTDPSGLADFLWDTGSTVAQIGINLKNRGFDLPTIANSVKWGVTNSDGTNLNYTDVAIALWNSGHSIDARKLADLLWDEGGSQQEIGQAMKYLGLSLETIADSVKRGVSISDGTGLNDIDVAIALWNSGYSGADGLDSRKLADLLWDVGANPIAIGQAMKYLGLTLENIADAVKWGITKADGTNLDYHQVAEALWNSGYSGADGFDSRKLADLLWDNSASQQKIGQAFNYLGLSLETIADSVKFGVTNIDGTNLNYIDATIALWNSGYGIDSRKLADLLWDEGTSQQEIGQAMKYLGLSLETIADAIDDGVTNSDGTSLNYTDVAIALWNSGYGGADGLNSNTLADLLWDEGASQQEIGQAMKYLGLSLEIIAYAIDDGVTNSDGTSLNYTDVAIALWNSGYSGADGLTSRKLADLLWDEGGDQKAIGQAMKYLGLSLETIADAVKWGVTKSDGTNLNYTDVAIALWNSGHSIDSRKLADLLWDTSASQSTIGEAMKYLGLSLEAIADAMDNGVTNDSGADFSYTDVAIALWNSGYSFYATKLADLLWDEGASQAQIGQAFKYLGLSLEDIAYSVKWGITQSNGSNLNYNSVAIAIWNSGYSGADGLNSRKLADLLWDEGASQGDIGKAFRYLGLSLENIADAVKWGVTQTDGTNLNFIDTAIALWNSGHSFDARKLADLLWDEGATLGEIGQSMKYLGLTLETIADAMDDGVTNNDGTGLTYNQVAKAIWDSGYGFTYRKLADLLWDEGASQGDIGKAFRYLGLSLEDITDSVKWGVTKSNGTNLNFIDVALAIWNSGYGFTYRKLADLLWDEGADQEEIGKAFRYLGLSLETIADSVKWGVINSDGSYTLNYTDVALALWYSGYTVDSTGGIFNTRDLADLLWDEGAGQQQIGKAMRYLGFSLEVIADAIDDGVTKSDGTNLNYNSVAEALWYSGHNIDSRKLADLLWDEGASQSLMGQAMRYLGFNNQTIGDAVKRGAGLNYIDATIAIKDSGNGWNSEGVADILYNLGAGFNDVYWAMRELGNNDFWATIIAGYKWVAKTITNLFSNFQNTSSFSGIITTYNTFTSIGDTLGDLVNKGSDAVGGVIDSVQEVYQDNKTIVDIVLLPYTLPAAIVVNTVEAIKTGDVEVIVDGLKKIPVLGTAVGVLEGVYNAATGNEKEVLISAIDSALAFYGASNVITPNMVEFAVDIFWELKDLDYQGAISATLENLGMQKTVSDLFVAVSWSAVVDPNWENVLNAALTKVGFNNASSFVKMAWDIIDQNYKEALKTGLEIVGFTKLGIDQAKADAFLNLAVAIRDGKPAQAADILIALSGNNQLVIQSSWIKDLKDANLANDRQAIQLGLSYLGFQDVTQWVNTIWAVKDGKYLDAISAVLVLGKFAEGQDWVKIIDNLQKENYVDALSTAFKLANFQDGQSLADAVLAVKKGDYITAFYESLNLIEGGRDLADAFKYLIEFDLQEFVTSMIAATPLLLKFFV